MLLADAGNDPVKRAALIGDIIRTIAIVPDDITRTIYIRECSAMMEIDEQVVLNQVNKQRLSKNEQKPSVPVTNRSTTEILPPDYSISEPSGQMQEVPVATAEPVSDQLPPDFPPPPEEEFSGSNEMPEIPPSAPVEETQVMTRQRSPYEAFEIALLRYVVRYGERVLYDYVDEETKERIVMRVAEFIRDDLERDDLSFYTPIFKQMLDEAANRCGEETFIAHRYFLSHPDPLVSRVAIPVEQISFQVSGSRTGRRQTGSAGSP